MGLVPHWPCVTDSVVCPLMGLNGQRLGNEQPAYAPPVSRAYSTNLWRNRCVIFLYNGVFRFGRTRWGSSCLVTMRISSVYQATCVWSRTRFLVTWRTRVNWRCWVTRAVSDVAATRQLELSSLPPQRTPVCASGTRSVRFKLHLFRFVVDSCTTKCSTDQKSTTNPRQPNRLS